MIRDVLSKLTVAAVMLVSITFFQNCGYIDKPMDSVLAAGGAFDSLASNGSAIPFATVQSKVLTPYCVQCHSPGFASGGVDLSSYAGTFATVSAGNPGASTLYTVLVSNSMPQGGAGLSSDLKMLVSQWISTGANNTVAQASTLAASAGANQTLILPLSSVTLSGSIAGASGSIVSVLWTQTGGSALTLTNANSLTASVSNLAAGSYSFLLTVKDSSGATASSSTTLNLSSAAASAASYTWLSTNVFRAKCVSCHGDMYSYTGVSSYLVAGSSSTSQLYIRVQSNLMPQGGPALSDTEKSNLKAWIDAGAPQN